MAEHWTLQDTSIITHVTPEQRTQLINNVMLLTNLTSQQWTVRVWMY